MVRVVLVGGGHAHLRVLATWARRPLRGARLDVVLERAASLYSGMVPGWVAGEYALAELSVDAAALARQAGAQVHVSAARALEPDARRVLLADGSALGYERLSLDVGSASPVAEVPGAAEHALPTRPLDGLVDGIRAFLERVGREDRRRPWRVAVVGAGAGGVELAFTLEARLARERRRRAVTLVEAAEDVLPGQGAGLARSAARHLRRRGIACELGAPVESVEPGAVRLADGRAVPFDLAVWAAGAAPPPLLVASHLPGDPQGFLRVRPTLQVPGRDEILGAGDAVCLESHPDTPKAGVYAVRAGPVLEHNLRALVEGGPLRRFAPRADALVLLNRGDGRALGARWGVAFGGRLARCWKDRLDRRFVEGHRAAHAAPGS